MKPEEEPLLVQAHWPDRRAMCTVYQCVLYIQHAQKEILTFSIEIMVDFKYILLVFSHFYKSFVTGWLRHDSLFI